MVDLTKYSVKGNAPANDLSKYAVASSAPTVDELLQFSSQREQPKIDTLSSKLGGRVEQARKSVFEKSQYPMQPIIGTSGAVGGAVNDIIGAVLNPFITKTVDTLSDSKVLQQIGTSRLGSKGIDATISGISKVTGAGERFTEKFPGTAQMAKDVFNTASLIPTGVGAKEGVNIASDVSRMALTPSEAGVQKKIIQGFTKAIKPTAKKTTATAERYDNNIVTAFKEIKNNKQNLNLEDATGEIVSRSPQSINELGQALDQTKSSLFNRYNDLAIKTGNTGVTLKTEPIAKELDNVITNKAIQLTSPDVVSYAKTWSERLREYGELDTQTTQEAIKLMNKNLESFYKNPTYENASKAAIDAGIANNLRKSLDDLIEKATGENYQELKSAYGALKAIENDVVRASMRDARKNAKGLLDYTDMFTGGQMVGGILSLNPAMFTKGAIERGFKEYIKQMNDPNRIIKGIFDAIDRNADEFIPKSKTVNYLQKEYPDGVPAGLSTKAVITPEQKLQIAKELENYDVTPIKTKSGVGGTSNYDADTNFRLSQLKDKNETGSFTDKDAMEARTLLEKQGIDFNQGATPQTTALLEEAKKYKSAEEFVKAQGNPILHGSESKFKEFDPTKRGINEKDIPSQNSFFFTDSMETAQSYGKNIQERYGTFKKPMTLDAHGKMYGDMRDELKDAVLKAKADGNDVVIIKNLSDRKDWGNYEPATHYAVLDTSSLKTRAELERIWKEASLER